MQLLLDRIPGIRGNLSAWLSAIAAALVLSVLDAVASFSPLHWPAGFDLMHKFLTAAFPPDPAVEPDKVMAANAFVLGAVVLTLYFMACMAVFSIAKGVKLAAAVGLDQHEAREIATEARGMRQGVVAVAGDPRGAARGFHKVWMEALEVKQEPGPFTRQVLLTLQPDDLTHPGRLKAALQLGVRDLFRPALRQVEWIDSFANVIAMASLTGTVLAIVVTAGNMTSPQMVALGLQAAMLKSLIGFSVRTGARTWTAMLRDEMQKVEDGVVGSFATVLTHEPPSPTEPPSSTEPAAEGAGE